MRAWLGGLLIGVVSTLVVVGLFMVLSSDAATQAGGGVPELRRTADGRPVLDGIWQALNTANWDLQDHSWKPGPPAFGALFATPSGQGVVEGNEIPYQTSAVEQKRKNFENRFTDDPFAKCYLPGVPRAMYTPFPFQILQTPRYVTVVSQYANAVRTIHLEKPKPNPIPAYMGFSVGRWEGDTLVVAVNDLRANWLDQAGNFYGDNASVVERYTPITPNHLRYEATIEDPDVFTRPWKVSMVLYRRMDERVQLTDFNCVELSEEMLYGKYRTAAN